MWLRAKVLPVLFIISLSGNILFVWQVYFKRQAGTDVFISPHWERKKALFGSLRHHIDPASIVFLGNSITADFEVSEIFGDYKMINRGISGDMAEGVLKRLGDITAGRPKAIFLLIGINDLRHGLPQEEIEGHYTAILQKIKEESPQTRTVVHTVLPVAPGYLQNPSLAAQLNGKVVALNRHIRECAHRHGCELLDLYAHFEINGSLDPDLTDDGLHLNAQGYYLWKELAGENL